MGDAGLQLFAASLRGERPDCTLRCTPVQANAHVHTGALCPLLPLAVKTMNMFLKVLVCL